MVFGRQASNNVHFPADKKENNGNLVVDEGSGSNDLGVPNGSRLLRTPSKKTSRSSGSRNINNNDDATSEDEEDSSESEDSLSEDEDAEETTMFVRQGSNAKRPLIVSASEANRAASQAANKKPKGKEKRRRHFTLGGSAEEELVVLRKPKKTSLNEEVAKPRTRRNRHTLFTENTVVVGNGGVGGKGGNPINYDIEAVRLDHERKVSTALVTVNWTPQGTVNDFFFRSGQPAW